MKNIAKILVLASSVALLAGCKGKAEWSSEEKELLEDYLTNVLPIYSKANLSLSKDEANGFLVATGNSASKEDVEDYVKLLTSKENGYVEDEEVSEDLYDFYDLENAHQLRKGDAKYVVEDVVAVGTDKKTGNMTVVATMGYSYFGSNFFSDGGYYPYDKVDYDDIIAAFDDSFEIGNTVDDGSEDGKKTFVAGDFPYPSDNSSWEGWGITEYTVAYPWTFGNVYSEDFLVMSEITFIAGTASDHAKYLTALTTAGYVLDKAATESNPYDQYKKSFADGDAHIMVWYEDEFFTDGTSALTVNYTFILK